MEILEIIVRIMELLPRNGYFNTKTPSINEPCCWQATLSPWGEGEGWGGGWRLWLGQKDNWNITFSRQWNIFLHSRTVVMLNLSSETNWKILCWKFEDPHLLFFWLKLCSSEKGQNGSESPFSNCSLYLMLDQSLFQSCL